MDIDGYVVEGFDLMQMLHFYRRLAAQVDPLPDEAIDVALSLAKDFFSEIPAVATYNLD